MAFLDSLINLLSSIESDKLKVHDERCVVMRNRNAKCLKCVHACTSGALAIEGGELFVFPDNCIGCGTCAAACPTSAIEVRTPTDVELTRALKRSMVKTGGHPVIACERAMEAAREELSARASLQGWRGALGLKAKDTPVLHEEMVCEVPCLGRVDESLLCAIAAYGAHDGTLVCRGCGSCNREPGGVQALDVMESAENLMGAFGNTFPLEFTDEMPARLIGPPEAEKAAPDTDRATHEAAAAPGAAADPGRRAFLTSAKDTAVTLAGDAASDALGLSEEPAPESVRPRYRKVNAKGTLSQFVPTRRTMLYNYLSRLGEPAADEVTNRVIGHIDIDTDTCSSCRMCAVFCPTGALERAEDGDFWGLLHRPAACVQCRSCESLCPQGAITVSDTVPMRQFMGREAVLYSMGKPKWKANKPDSMYNKIHQVIGEDLEMCMF